MASGKLGEIEFRLNNKFNLIAKLITGSHPNTNIFHSQWIMDKKLLGLARDFLISIPSKLKILDVGCGNGPYWNLNSSLEWHGIDIVETVCTTSVVQPSESFPFTENSFDFVICTQVLEHVKNPDFLISQIYFVLKPGGELLLNVPFLYPLHGLPNDYQRFTPIKIKEILHDFEIEELRLIGGIGSSISTLYNNFWRDWGESSFARRIIYVVCWPLFLLSNFAFNVLGLLFDRIDSTSRYPLIISIRCSKS